MTVVDRPRAARLHRRRRRSPTAGWPQRLASSAAARRRAAAGHPAGRQGARLRPGDGGDGRAQPRRVQRDLAGHQRFSRRLHSPVPMATLCANLSAAKNGSASASRCRCTWRWSAALVLARRRSPPSDARRPSGSTVSLADEVAPEVDRARAGCPKPQADDRARCSRPSPRPCRSRSRSRAAPARAAVAAARSAEPLRRQAARRPKPPPSRAAQPVPRQAAPPSRQAAPPTAAPSPPRQAATEPPARAARRAAAASATISSGRARRAARPARPRHARRRRSAPAEAGLAVAGDRAPAQAALERAAGRRGRAAGDRSCAWDLNRDGSLAGRRAWSASRASPMPTAPQAERHAEQAIRAVQLAAPFDLPDAISTTAWKRVALVPFRQETVAMIAQDSRCSLLAARRVPLPRSRRSSRRRRRRATPAEQDGLTGIGHRRERVAGPRHRDPRLRHRPRRADRRQRRRHRRARAASWREVISADLRNNGLFKPTGPDALPRPAYPEVTAPGVRHLERPRRRDAGAGLRPRRRRRQADGRLLSLRRRAAAGTGARRAGWSRRPTGAARRTSAPTWSIRGCRAKARSSTARSPTSPRPGPRTTGSSGWRSWIRTAPTTASSPTARRPR